jgi:DNA-binding transcriptional LysR family regulator
MRVRSCPSTADKACFSVIFAPPSPLKRPLAPRAPLLRRLRKTYKEVFENEDLEMMAGSGYEGYVTDGLDLGITFDPEDNTNHRYAYYVEETDWQVSPALGCGSDGLCGQTSD